MLGRFALGQPQELEALLGEEREPIGAALAMVDAAEVELQAKAAQRGEVGRVDEVGLDEDEEVIDLESARGHCGGTCCEIGRGSNLVRLVKMTTP